MTIETLIQQDAVETIRDQVSAILALETAAQVALATTAGEPDPQEWAFRVFQERSNPWDEFEDDPTPLVNVMWDSSQFDMSASNIFERQKAEAVIHVDCYGYGVSADVVAGGHVAGDQQALEISQRTARLVRNILMAAEYTYLGLRGVVWRRWVSSITIFAPQQDNQNAQQVVGARISLRVEFNEYSPQVVPEELDLLTIDVRRTEDNQIVLEADYDYS